MRADKAILVGELLDVVGDFNVRERLMLHASG